MKNIVFLSASPKVNEPSVSKHLVGLLESRISAEQANKIMIDARSSLNRKQTAEDYALLSAADAIVIAFPLYIFCMPGLLTRYLENYYHDFLQSGRPLRQAKVYAIVNCGFPEPEINLEAVRVIGSFCRHIGANFRMGLMIGGGGMLLGAADAPFVKKAVAQMQDAFSSIIKDIFSDEQKPLEDVCIRMTFPRRLYLFMGNMGWPMLARKYGLKKKDLYRKPYPLE